MKGPERGRVVYFGNCRVGITRILAIPEYDYHDLNLSEKRGPDRMRDRLRAGQSTLPDPPTMLTRIICLFLSISLTRQWLHARSYPAPPEPGIPDSDASIPAKKSLSPRRGNLRCRRSLCRCRVYRSHLPAPGYSSRDLLPPRAGEGVVTGRYAGLWLTF